MKVRILQGFAHYTPGQVFDDWPAGMCEIFIAKGLIEPVADEIEVAAAEPEVEKAEVPARRKRK